MTKTNAAKIWELDLQDDLFALQHPEDGSEFTASVFYVVATNPVTGERYAHDHSFYSAHVVSGGDFDGDMGGIASYREEALAKAEAFLTKVKAAQAAGRFTSPVDRLHWNETYPVYGSRAYVAAITQAAGRFTSPVDHLPF
jgi:hypothetical protein